MAVCVCGGGDGIPLIYSPTGPITVDGDVADWGTTSQAGTILADEDNNVCDGPSGGLTDLDAPVQSTGRDIVQFSFTYDDTWLHFYTERVGSTSNTQTFLYYADTNADGYLDSTEPVIVAEWQGSNRQVNIYLATYSPTYAYAATGDPTTDPSTGAGDGWSLPGRLANISSAIGTYSGKYGSTDGLAMEFGVEWSSLGFTGPVGHSIHVSSTNANKNAANLGAQIDDNLGGCGGGSGTLQYADLDFQGAYSLLGARASTVTALHHLVNLGNGDDTFAFAYTVTGTHSPTVALYVDDGDSVLGTGDWPIAGPVALASGGSVDVLIVYGIDPSALGQADVTTTATSQFSLTRSVIISDAVTDTILVVTADVVVLKSLISVNDSRAFNSANTKAVPGAAVRYNLQITNVGNGSTDADTVSVRDTIPSGVELYVGDGTSSPVLFSDSGSGLTYSFGGLGAVGDDLFFTSDSGPAPAYTYLPAGDTDGYDSNVRGVRVAPGGSLPAGTGFNLGYTVRVR